MHDDSKNIYRGLKFVRCKFQQKKLNALAGERCLTVIIVRVSSIKIPVFFAHHRPERERQCI